MLTKANDNLATPAIMISIYPVEDGKWRAVILDDKFNIHTDYYSADSPEYAAYRAKYCMKNGAWPKVPRRGMASRKKRVT